MLREERIDALLESAQTQSYNTAMELGQRGIRFVAFFNECKVLFLTKVCHWGRHGGGAQGTGVDG